MQNRVDKLNNRRQLQNECKNKILTVLDEYKYPEYSKYLSNADIDIGNFKRQGIRAAAVMTDDRNNNHKTILVDQEWYSKATDFDIMYTFMHELLHIILQHEERAIERAAEKIGVDPQKIPPERVEEVMELAYKDDGGLLYSEYGDCTLQNIAADAEVSRYYTPEMLARHIELGGIVLEDLPELQGKTYEEALQILEDEWSWAKFSDTDTIDAHFDESGNLIVDTNTERIPATFKTQQVSNKLVVGTVDILSEREIEVIRKHSPEIDSIIGKFQMWLYPLGDIQEDTSTAYLQGTIRDVGLRSSLEVHPIINVPRIKNYIKNGVFSIGDVVTIHNIEFLILPHYTPSVYYLITKNPITICTFQKNKKIYFEYGNQFDISLIKEKLNAWATENNFRGMN